MNITKITEENIAYFKAVIPEPLLARSNFKIGAIDNGTACGVLLADVAENEAELLWLFVDENHRRKGCGDLLMSTFTDSVDKLKTPISFFSLIESDDNMDFISFLDNKTGFVRELDNKGDVLSFRLHDIDEAQLKGTQKPGIRPLSSALSREEKQIHKLIKQTFGVAVSDEDMNNWKSSDLSFIKVKDNTVEAFILLRFEYSLHYEKINVDYIYDTDNNIKSFMDLADSVVKQLKEEQLGPNTKISAVALNDVITGFVAKITDGKFTKDGKLTVWTRRK